MRISENTHAGVSFRVNIERVLPFVNAIHLGSECHPRGVCHAIHSPAKHHKSNRHGIKKSQRKKPFAVPPVGCHSFVCMK